MGFVIGFIVTVVTFPGVIVHEMAHQFFCRLYRIAVLDVCYFRLGNPAGYVVHEQPQNAYQHIMIGIGPFLFNTIIGASIAFSGAIPVIKFETGSVLDYFLVWLGVSITMHSFPSTGDAAGIWKALRSEKASPAAKLVGTPIVAFIYLGALGSVFWLDLLYGVGVAMLIPSLLVSAFA